MPFRIAMPNEVMKPMVVATDKMPPETYTPMTPPRERERQVDQDDERAPRAVERGADDECDADDR
jgi:hypothetical protein